MVSSISFPLRSSWLALLCASLVMLAWAAPLATDVSESYLKDRPMTPGQEATDPADSHSPLCDVTDEPVLLASIGGTAMHRLVFSFQPAQSSAWAWSPLLPIRPPIILNSI
jgi:hypothetical protein